jgi:hypothetical protein
MSWGVVALLTTGLLVMALPVAWQARKRGYGMLLWLAAGTLGNALFLLVILGVLPDFARRARRQRYRRSLEEKLAGKAGPAGSGPVARGGRLDRSLGDLATQLPERSLGDDETRL